MRLLSPVVFALAITLLGPPSARADGCRRVRTTIVTTFFVEGCTSPWGVCTAGTIESGVLEGSSKFQALSMAQGPSPDVILYTGELVITTARGTLTLRDYGLLNSGSGRYFEMQQVVKGTKAFRKATGALTSEGWATGTGFAGTLTGAVCSGERERPEDAEELAELDSLPSDFDAEEPAE